jgi:hypothetical protein
MKTFGILFVIFSLILVSPAIAGDKSRKKDDRNWIEKRADRHEDNAHKGAHILGHILRNANISFTYVSGGNGMPAFFHPGQYVPPAGCGTPHYYDTNGVYLNVNSGPVPYGVPRYVPMYWYQNGSEWYPMDTPMRRRVTNRAILEAKKGLPYYYAGQLIIPPGYTVRPGYGPNVQIIVVREGDNDEDEREAREGRDDDYERPDSESDTDSGKPYVRRAR